MKRWLLDRRCLGLRKKGWLYNMNEKKLKDVINEEIRNVTALLISGEHHDASIIKTKWLQSLQRIDDVCKNRNRY